MENAISKINDFFDSMEWAYLYDKEGSFYVSEVSLNEAVGEIKLIIFIRPTSYTVSVIMHDKVKPRFYPQVSEYLHRVNWKLMDGNFDLDFTSGEIHYRTYVNFKNVQISKEIVRSSILIPFAMFNKYGEDLLKLMADFYDPQSLLINTENSQ